MVDWLGHNGFEYTATLNGVWISNQGLRSKMVRQGLRRGLPDLIIQVPAEKCRSGKNALLFLEMKRARELRKDGKGYKKSTYDTTAEQKQWLGFVGAVDGCDGIVGYGADDAIEKVKQYLR